LLRRSVGATHGDLVQAPFAFLPIDFVEITLNSLWRKQVTVVRNDALHRFDERSDLRRRLGFGWREYCNDAVGDGAAAFAVAAAGSLRDLFEARFRPQYPWEIEIDPRFYQRCGDNAAGPARF